MKKSFAQAWQDYKYLFCIGGLYALVCIAQAFELGIFARDLIRWIWMSTRHVIGLAYICIMFVMILAYGREVVRAKCELKKAGTGFGVWFREYLSSPCFAGGCYGLLAAYLSVFFIIQKATIRWVNPYVWDQKFEAWDKALHLGRHPYEYLLDIFGGRGFDGLFQAAYVGWFLFMYIALGYCLFWDRDRLRKLRFVSIFLISWIVLGGFGATILSSVCPVFYHHFYPDLPDVYGRLTAYMADHKDDMSGIVFVQGLLLKWNYKTAIIIPNGIAAMPSMHAAISTLIVLYTYSIGRFAFTAAFITAALIIVSSIYFGFHYAIDSYFSILSVSLMWWLAGKYIARKNPAGAAHA